MNAHAKMVLVPENEMKARDHIEQVLNKEVEHENRKEPKSLFSGISEMLNSQLPAAMKVQLFNYFMSSYLTKKSRKKSIEETNEVNEKSNEEKAVDDEIHREIEQQNSEKPKRKYKKKPKLVVAKTRRARNPKINRKYINDQFGTGRIIPIRWTTLKTF